jgi:hypothetical protein
MKALNKVDLVFVVLALSMIFVAGVGGVFARCVKHFAP